MKPLKMFIQVIFQFERTVSSYLFPRAAVFSHIPLRGGSGRGKGVIYYFLIIPAFDKL
jgi:hypothetical protein